MNDFIIELDKLGERPHIVEYSFAAEAIDAAIEDVVFPEPVTGQVTFSRLIGDVMARGALHTCAEGRCARCLDPTRVKIDVAVEELWTRRAPKTVRGKVSEDEDVEPDLAHPLGEDSIEVAEIYRELLLAELPDRFLCGEECRGLCPRCGANLNHEPCRCTPDQQAESDLQPDWKKKLKNLKLDS